MIHETQGGISIARGGRRRAAAPQTQSVLNGAGHDALCGGGTGRPPSSASSIIVE
eukprot:CAMPEP_0196678932 /NCGR_PEP_ID=MMETSP1090-20130531/6664_1 /TAXON_ID=37098 /ORGANISM="Isochrysis sp, Strain CCMP1244" /LENGTH=54 /DNA_ID=CAMNT_0042017111 /DNA_START=86 /DNA_END=250 /DNA_ORIENTATION=-